MRRKYLIQNLNNSYWNVTFFFSVVPKLSAVSETETLFYVCCWLLTQLTKLNIEMRQETLKVVQLNVCETACHHIQYFLAIRDIDTLNKSGARLGCLRVTIKDLKHSPKGYTSDVIRQKRVSHGSKCYFINCASSGRCASKTWLCVMYSVSIFQAVAKLKSWNSKTYYIVVLPFSTVTLDIVCWRVSPHFRGLYVLTDRLR